MGLAVQPPLPRRRPATAPVSAPTTAGATSARGNAYEAGQSNAVLQAASTGTIPQRYANKSAVWKMGYEDGVAQGEAGIANIEADARTTRALADASTATGVSVDNLTAMAIIESTGNRSIGTNSAGYTGLMQMGSAATREVGMRQSQVTGAANVGNNALAGAKYWNLNDQRLDDDVPRDPLHMYLAHQQGAGGTNRLMDTLATDPTAATTGAQRGNLPEAVRTARGRSLNQRDFYDYWAGKMQAIQDILAERRSAAT